MPAIDAFNQSRNNQSIVKIKVGFWQSSDVNPGGANLGVSEPLNFSAFCVGESIGRNLGRGLGGGPAHFSATFGRGIGQNFRQAHDIGDTTFRRWY